MTKSGGVFQLPLLALFVTLAGAQQGAAPKRAAAQVEKPLVLTEAIPLENAKGRFDHFAMGGGRLFVAAPGQ